MTRDWLRGLGEHKEIGSGAEAEDFWLVVCCLVAGCSDDKRGSQCRSLYPFVKSSQSSYWGKYRGMQCNITWMLVAPNQTRSMSSIGRVGLLFNWSVRRWMGMSSPRTFVMQWKLSVHVQRGEEKGAQQQPAGSQGRVPAAWDSRAGAATYIISVTWVVPLPALRAAPAFSHLR